MVKLVEKISSLMAKTGQIFHHHQPAMNENSARKIQKNAFKQSIAVRSEDCSPPYLKIAEQLENPENQIFAAAVYHLVKIAKSSKRYRLPIIDILEKYARTPHLSTYRTEYIAKKTAELGK